MHLPDKELVNSLKKPFVILCYPRTGSYLLVDLLNQFPEISCHGEIFKESYVELSEEVKLAVGYTLSQRNNDPFGFLNKLWDYECNKITGFKLFRGHNTEIWKWIESNENINKVCLIRPPFQIYVSLERAKITGVWVDRNGKKNQSPQTQIKFNPDQFDSTMKIIRRHNQNLRELVDRESTSCRLINYSELSKKSKIRQIASFIGVTEQPENIRYRLHKQTIEKYSDLFENYDEMMSYLELKYPKIHKSLLCI